jgi:hypothetical protein
MYRLAYLVNHIRKIQPIPEDVYTIHGSEVIVTTVKSCLTGNLRTEFKRSIEKITRFRSMSIRS